jgi:hypothetical protein
MRLAIVAVLLLCGFSGFLFAVDRKDRSVVVISRDGFPAYALDDR